MKCIWLLYLLSSSLLWSVSGMNALQLVLFNETYANTKNSRCLDGSPMGFYWGRGAQEDKWIIFLEGGGLCLTPESCQRRAKSQLGSSRLWPNTTHGTGLTSAFEVENPTFHSWNRVLLPYCSGDLWSGTVTKPSPTTFNFYFSGHLNLAAVLDYLTENHGLGSVASSEVVLSGESAGGVGVLNNIDYVAARLEDTRVVGVPIGGWYYPKVSLYPAWLVHMNVEIGSHLPSILYKSYLNENCVQKNKDKPWLCGPVSANYLYQYIKSPLFIAENMFDSDQIFDELQCPKSNTSKVNSFVYYYGKKMREAMTMVLTSPKNDGLYMPSCLSHTGNFLDSPSSTVDGYTFLDALNLWYQVDSEKIQLIDSCKFANCNPSCPQDAVLF